MKILLVNPAHLEEMRNDDHLFLPLGLLAIASYLKRHRDDVSITILDMELERRYKRTFKQVLSEQGSGFKFIGITDHYTNFYNALRMADDLKNQLPQSKIILGGVHATACHKEIIANFPFVDAVISGEGEKPFLQILRNQTLGIGFHENVDSLTLRKCGTTVSNPDGKVLDLRSLPPIDYSFIEMERYLKERSFSRQQWIETGRGCTNKCAFCSSSFRWRHSVRYCTLQKIHTDIEELRKYGIHNVMFTHDNILHSKAYIKRLSRYFKASNVKTEWSCYATVNGLSTDVIRAISSAGCKSVFAGFETSCRDIQESISKTYDCNEAIQRVQNCCKNNIEVNGNFIFDLPGASRSSIDADFAFALKLKKVGAGNIQFSCLKNMPGSQLFAVLQATHAPTRTSKRYKYGARCRRRDRDKLFSFFLKNGQRKFNGVPALAIGKIANYLLEYYPFTLIRASGLQGISLLAIARRIFDIDMVSLSNIHWKRRLYNLVNKVVRDHCKHDELLNDLYRYESAVNKLSSTHKNSHTISINVSHDIVSYIDELIVRRLSRSEKLMFESDGDNIHVRKGDYYEAA